MSTKTKKSKKKVARASEKASSPVEEETPAKKRKRTSEAQRTAARAESKKKTVEEVFIPKPHVWGYTGWCSDGLGSTNVVDRHRHCGGVTESPSAITHCKCLCHATGVLDLVGEHELRLEQVCKICSQAGKPIKRDGLKMWKCEQKHRWPRTGK